MRRLISSAVWVWRGRDQDSQNHGQQNHFSWRDGLATRVCPVNSHQASVFKNIKSSPHHRLVQCTKTLLTNGLETAFNPHLLPSLFPNQSENSPDKWSRDCIQPASFTFPLSQ